jgi:hypothetical protein
LTALPRLYAERLSKLRFNRPLVDHRPHLHDSFVAKLIEDVLGEVDPPAVDREIEKEALRPAVEPEPARDVRRVADQEFDVELKVRDLLEIALEHSAVTGEAKRPPVVARVVGDESMQIGPVLPVEAGDIGPVEVGESGSGHPRPSLKNPFAFPPSFPLPLVRRAKGAQEFGVATPNSFFFAHIWAIR